MTIEDEQEVPARIDSAYPAYAVRREDILPLAERLLGFYRDRHGSDAERFSEFVAATG